MQPLLKAQDQLEELSLTLDKMNVVAADVADYLQNSSETLLQYYLEENRLKAAIVMDYAWKAKEEVKRIKLEVKKIKRISERE